jgi:hypothetical protein
MTNHTACTTTAISIVLLSVTAIVLLHLCGQRIKACQVKLVETLKSSVVNASRRARSSWLKRSSWSTHQRIKSCSIKSSVVRVAV